jgi:predicted RNA-binding Zn ribbon-like protein
MTGDAPALNMATLAPAARGVEPAALARIEAFVNTLEVETGEDELDGSDALGAWLVAHGLLAPGHEGADVTIDDADVARARSVRESIRELLAANAGHGADPAAVGVLGAAADRAPLVVRFTADGRAGLVPATGGLDAAFAILFADIAAAIVDGSWSRLKACRNDDCRWAYYDGSKNRSGRWCSMASCGNRMKGRAYRRRARSEPAA